MWHLWHSASWTIVPIGVLRRRIQNSRKIFQHFRHWICMTFPEMSTSSQTSRTKLSTGAPMTINDRLPIYRFPQKLFRVLIARLARKAHVSRKSHRRKTVLCLLFSVFLSWCLDWHRFSSTLRILTTLVCLESVHRLWNIGQTRIKQQRSTSTK